MYEKHRIPLTPGQVDSLRAAVNANRGVTLRVTSRPDSRPVPVLLTKTQASQLKKAHQAGHGADLKLSKSQVGAMKKDGGVFPLLAAIPGIIAAAAPAIAKTAALGALSGAAGLAANKAIQAASGKGLRLGPPRRGAGLKKRR